VPAPSSPSSVLLIDDSHEDLFLFKRLLSRIGLKHAIVTIDDGEEAAVYLRACLAPGAGGLKPSAIFCDVRMPKQNGFEVLRWVRRHHVLRTIPFFILSGGNVPEDHVRAQELGATAYLVKFPAAEELKKILEQAAVLLSVQTGEAAEGQG
jgi:CheY-like chemotaxis protein